MPLYFFDSDDGTNRFSDHEGTDLTDDAVARDEATQAMAELAKDHLPGSGPQKNITMWVRDSTGKTVMVLTLNFSVALVSE
jgi:predicted transcriptional regulator YheO